MVKIYRALHASNKVGGVGADLLAVQDMDGSQLLDSRIVKTARSAHGQVFFRIACDSPPIRSRLSRTEEAIAFD